MGSTIGGILLTFVGGVFGGLFTAPMRGCKGWEWENSWLVYSLYGMVLFPWILVFFSVNDAVNVYASAPGHSIALAVTFGIFWGIGSVLFGLGVKIVGNSLGFSIILGMTSAIGSALPLVVLHSSEVGSNEGICTWAGLAVVVGGLALLGKAGGMRDAELVAEKEPMLLTNEAPQQQTSFKVGMIICVMSGIVSPMLNLAIAFGKGVADAAEDRGTSSTLSNNAIWALAIGGGFLVNFTYCVYLLRKNNTWRNFSLPPQKQCWANTLFAVLAGMLWFGGNVLYGIGASMLGDLGTVLGWPIFISAMVMSGNIVGVLAGEWKGVGSRAKLFLGGGLFVLFLAVVVIALGSVV